MSSRRAYRTEQISGAPYLERPGRGNSQQKKISNRATVTERRKKRGKKKPRADESFNEEVINFLELLRVQ